MPNQRIKMSPMGPSFNINPDHHVEALHEWEEGTFLQGGDRGIVITRDPENPTYRTAFVEAFPPSSGFFRGEGSSIAEAEKNAWDKWRRSEECPGHEWDARGYTNGGGFCKICKRFGSNVFTGEQLDQFCATCGVGTTYGNVGMDKDNKVWYCKEHIDVAHRSLYDILLAIPEDERTESQRMQFSHLSFLLSDDDE